MYLHMYALYIYKYVITYFCIRMEFYTRVPHLLTSTVLSYRILTLSILSTFTLSFLSLFPMFTTLLMRNHFLTFLLPGLFLCPLVLKLTLDFKVLVYFNITEAPLGLKCDYPPFLELADREFLFFSCYSFHLILTPFSAFFWILYNSCDFCSYIKGSFTLVLTYVSRSGTMLLNHTPVWIKLSLEIIRTYCS